MTIKRSYFHLLFGSLGVALVLSNCTVKEDNDGSCEKGDKDVGCDCPGNAEGYQECGKDGVFGACICPDGSGGTAGTSNAGAPTDAGSDGGGTTSTGGTGGSTGGTGGTSEAGADAGGAGGEGGEPALEFADCDECIATQCEEQFNACADDEQCLDQYAAVSGCIEEDRMRGLVTRDRVRGCGVTVGLSPEPDTVSLWAPEEMNQKTTDLINCMASGIDVYPPDGNWANDPKNFPNGSPAPWPASSCAKKACTSKVVAAP